MARQIVLLRGINVGRNRRVSMAALRELLSEAGYEDVRTHLQSGNVVLTSNASAKRLESELEKHLAVKLGLEIEVLVRTRNQLADVIKRNPGVTATARNWNTVTKLLELADE